MSKALIVGSLNLDITVKVNNIPKLGETIIGEKYFESFGGKGANQAVAASKLGMEVSMIGKVGNDSIGEKLLNNLVENKVNASGIIVSDIESGKAIIQIDNQGNNNIVVIPGSNFSIITEEIEELSEIFETNNVLITQYETPIDVVEYSLKKAKKLGLITIVNPAPAKKVSKDLYKYIDFLILNETELEIIFDINCDDIDFYEKVKKITVEYDLNDVILTLGDKGSIHIDKKGKIDEFKAYKVKAIDTTAAGDTFIGAFTNKYLETKNVSESIKFATAASAIVVTRFGAQNSIPSIKEVDAFIKNLGNI